MHFFPFNSSYSTDFDLNHRLWKKNYGIFCAYIWIADDLKNREIKSPMKTNIWFRLYDLKSIDSFESFNGYMQRFCCKMKKINHYKLKTTNYISFKTFTFQIVQRHAKAPYIRRFVLLFIWITNRIVFIFRMKAKKKWNWNLIDTLIESLTHFKVKKLFFKNSKL